MYISKDKAGRLYADTMAKVDFGTTLYEDKSDTRSKDAEVDIAIAYGVELFYKTLIESISKDDKMDEEAT